MTSSSGSSSSSTNPMAVGEERLMVNAYKSIYTGTCVSVSLLNALFERLWSFSWIDRSLYVSGHQSPQKTTNAFRCFPRNPYTSTMATTNQRNTCMTMCLPRIHHKMRYIKRQPRRSLKTCSKATVRPYLRMVLPALVRIFNHQLETSNHKLGKTYIC